MGAHYARKRISRLSGREHDMREACKHIARLGLGGSSRKSEGNLVRDRHQAHDTMMKSVTRFRVLASDRTADTALKYMNKMTLILSY
jgi:hypothetical protein